MFFFSFDKFYFYNFIWAYSQFDDRVWRMRSKLSLIRCNSLKIESQKYAWAVDMASNKILKSNQILFDRILTNGTPFGMCEIIVPSIVALLLGLAREFIWNDTKPE